MLSHGHSVPLLISYQILVWNGWLAIEPFIRTLVRRQPLVPLSRRPVLWHLLAACIVAAVHTAWWSFLLVALRPYDVRNTNSFADAYRSIGQSALLLELLLYVGVLVSIYALDYYDKYREQEVQAAQLQTSLAEARLHALELQIQPHFLFNTMNAISSLVRSGRNDEAVVMIAGLSDLLRYTLDHAGNQHVAVEDEVAILERYLEIQRTRFPDRLSFEIDVAEEVKRAFIPTLILQPLAENAVRHGVSREAGAGRVGVRAWRDEQMLRVEVFNTGTLTPTERRGIGLRNTTERLRQIYGEQFRFDLRVVEGGVLASLSIPWSAAA